MQNKAMQRKLASGECIDVNAIGTRTNAGDFKLTKFVDGKDYCDATSEEWIWSIGKHKQTGQIYASKTNRFYQNPNYECLWLR